MDRKLESKLIKPVQVSADCTIFDAFKQIEDKLRMIVTIVDEDNKLLGITSPGDLRRAILHGVSVDAPLNEVMNHKPIFIREKDLLLKKDFSEILEKLRPFYGNSSLLYALVPVIDEDDRILGLISVDALTAVDSDKQPDSIFRTVLIVGGAGYIGSVLSRLLLREGWNVKVLDKLLYSDRSVADIQHKRFTLIPGDATNIDDIVQALEGVDAVVYLAELVGDPACSLAPQTALKTNYLSVTSMAHVCSHLNINRFIYTSSCSVYGASSNPEDLLNETSALQPVSLYARMKTLVEQSILSVCNLPNPEFSPTILRLATVFGNSYRPRFDLVVNTFVKNAIQKGEIQVFGGNQWRPNVHVKDVCQAIIRSLYAPLDKVRAQCFNVGSEKNNHTINELADFAKDVFPDLNVKKEAGAVDQRNYRVCFDKIEKVLDYKAEYSVLDGMQELKEAYQQENQINLNDPLYNNAAVLKELNYS